MASFIIFDTSNGTIRTTLNCPPDEISNHIAPNEDAIVHPYVSDAHFKVDPVTRQVVEIGG